MDMMYRFIIILSLLCFCSTKQETVKVSLYYESLCPYSKEFVVTQLYPGYQKLGDSLELELIPYGKAKTKNKQGEWLVTCQHGYEECYGNKIQACVLGQNLSQEVYMNFIGCIMGTDNPSLKKNAKKCARKCKVPWENIKSCANGNQGTELLVHYGNITNKLVPKLTYVPHIIFNDVFDEAEENEARDDFLKVVCDKFSEKPKEC